MRRLAIFDWNGTLFDDAIATLVGTNASLAFFGKDPITLEQEQEAFSFPLIHFYEKIGVSADKYLKHAEEAGQIFLKAYNDYKHNCSLAKDVEPILKWLTQHDVTCIILSNHAQDILNADIKHFKIDHYFKEISGNNDLATIVSGLNKLERLETFMEENHYPACEAMIIGDSHEEPDIARKMNLLGVSITGGQVSRPRLEKYKKDYLIDCMSELPKILADEWDLALSEQTR